MTQLCHERNLPPLPNSEDSEDSRAENLAALLNEELRLGTGRREVVLKSHVTKEQARAAIRRFLSSFKYGGCCWEWSNAPKDGYGTIGINGRSLRASRFSFLYYFGAIPTGHYMCHRCDNPPCVNPAHLFAGTPKDNMTDMDKKGRRVRAERMPLIPPLAAEYKALRVRVGTQTAVAKLLGIFQETIARREGGKIPITRESLFAMAHRVYKATGEIPVLSIDDE
jgi:hypothetical protein